MIDPRPWLGREHPGPRATPLPLSAQQRRTVEEAIRPAKTEARVARRGEALLLLAAGVGAEDVSAIIGVHVRTVFKWKKKRFRELDDVNKVLQDAPRSGRPVSLSPKPTPHASRQKRRSRRRMSAYR
jgi:hypothetical protein